MRSIVALFLGLFSVTVAIPVGCSGPESVTHSGGPSSGSDSSTGATAGGGGTSGAGGFGGAPLDSWHECMDFCVTANAVCMHSYDCVAQCEEDLKNAGPECQDDFAAFYACWTSWVDTAPPDLLCVEESPECLMLAGDADRCQQEYGCVPAIICFDEPDPNGGVQCYCRARCQQRELKSLCWIEGTTQVCECSIDGVAIGMCEEPQEQACDKPRLYERCCNQYFMIP